VLLKRQKNNEGYARSTIVAPKGGSGKEKGKKGGQGFGWTWKRGRQKHRGLKTEETVLKQANTARKITKRHRPKGERIGKPRLVGGL